MSSSLAVIVCGEVEARCRCVLPAGHAGEAHECDCGGAWLEQDGELVVVAWPESPGAYPRGRSAARPLEAPDADATGAETIVYEDGKAVAFLNCSPATIMDEAIEGIVRKTGSEMADWLKRYGP